jgi:serine protease Do
MAVNGGGPDQASAPPVEECAMTTWRTWSVAAAVALAAVVSAWIVAPPAEGQVVVAGRDAGGGMQARIMEAFGGPGPQIGLGIRDLEPADAEKMKLPGTAGVLVQNVGEDSPAARAGVRTDDVIVTFDGERVRSAAQLTRLVRETPAGRTVPLQVVRGGSRVDLQVTPEAGRPAMAFRRGAPPAPPGPPAPPELPGEPGPPILRDLPDFDFDFDAPTLFAVPGRTARLGVQVSPLTGDLPGYFGAKAGVLVNAVTADSPAAKAGIRVGDVITAIDGTTVTRPAELRRALLDAREKREVEVRLVRDKKETAVTVSLPPPRERETRGVRL